MPDDALGNLLTLGIEQADMVLLTRPIETYEPANLVTHPSTSNLLRATATPVDPCTGAPGANLLLDVRRGRPCRGTCPTEVLAAQVGYGGSRQVGPGPVYPGWLSNIMKGTGWAKARRHGLSTAPAIHGAPCPRVRPRRKTRGHGAIDLQHMLIAWCFRAFAHPTEFTTGETTCRHIGWRAQRLSIRSNTKNTTTPRGRCGTSFPEECWRAAAATRCSKARPSTSASWCRSLRASTPPRRISIHPNTRRRRNSAATPTTSTSWYWWKDSPKRNSRVSRIRCSAPRPLV